MARMNINERVRHRARIPPSPRAAPRVLLARSRYVRACMQIYIELSVLQLAEIHRRESSLSLALSSSLFLPDPHTDRNLVRGRSQYSKYLICFCSLRLPTCAAWLVVPRVHRRCEFRRDAIVAWNCEEYAAKNGINLG